MSKLDNSRCKGNPTGGGKVQNLGEMLGIRVKRYNMRKFMDETYEPIAGTLKSKIGFGYV
jgi:hypothetical protein